MKAFLLAAAAAAALVAGPALGQDSDAEKALVSAFEAEHAAWMEDVERWKADHDRAVAILKAALERFEEENALDRHSAQTQEHGDVLGDGELADLAGRHARARSRHEELRETHHHLMDAVSMVEKAIDEHIGSTED